MVAGEGRVGCVHEEINATQLCCTSLCGFVEGVDVAYVDGTDAKDFGTGAGGGYVFGYCVCFLDVAAYDASIGAEVDQGAHLS